MGSAASRQRDAEQNEKGSSANTNRRRSCVPDPVTVTETPREGCNDAAARMDMIKRQIEQGLHERRPGQDEEERREREESVRTMMTVGGGFGAAQARGGLVAADDDEEETEEERAKRLRRERKASLAEGITKAVFCGVCKLETPQHCVCLKEAALKAKREEDREWREKLAKVAFLTENKGRLMALSKEMEEAISKLPAEQQVSSGKGDDRSMAIAEKKQQYQNQTVVDEYLEAIAHRVKNGVKPHPHVALGLAKHEFASPKGSRKQSLEAA